MAIIRLFCSSDTAKKFVKLREEFTVFFSTRSHSSVRIIQCIQNTNDSIPTLDEIEAWLIVVKGNVWPVNALSGVKILFDLKKVTVEMSLQLLVAVVDQKLFVSIVFKAFEAVNIKNTDETDIVAWSTRSLLTESAIDRSH